MLPDNVASSVSYGGLFLPPDDQVSTGLIDYELGGKDIQDTSEGLMFQKWTLRTDAPNFPNNVMISAPTHPESLLFVAANIQEISFTFDQNMRPAVAYNTPVETRLRWYDSSAGQYVTSIFPLVKNPKMSLDDKRISASNTSDMIFAYIREGGLYYRQQRDRFLVERLLRSGLTSNMSLKNIGMNNVWRMQFELVVGG